MTSFFGCPLSSGVWKGLNLLTIVRRLKDKVKPILLHTTNSTLANFLAENTGRTVGCRSSTPMNILEMTQAIAQGKLFTVAETYVSDKVINIQLAPVTSATGTTAIETYSIAKKAMATRIEGLPEGSIILVSAFALAEWMCQDSENLILGGESEKKCQVIMNFDISQQLFVVGIGDCFINPMKPKDCNVLFKLYYMNVVTFRYHKTPFSAIITQSELKSVEPFMKMHFKFADNIKIVEGMDDYQDAELMSGNALAKITRLNFKSLKDATRNAKKKIVTKSKVTKEEEVSSESELSDESNDEDFGSGDGEPLEEKPARVSKYSTLKGKGKAKI